MVTIQGLSKVDISSQTPIWFYSSIGQLIDIFEEKALPANNESQHLDDNPHSLPPNDCFTNIQAETNQLIRDVTCICEFYSTAGDTYTAWAQHKPNQIAIQTSIDQLQTGLLEAEFNIHIVPVTDYCQLDTISINPKNSTQSKITLSDFASQFSHKNDKYTQEQAIRLVGVHSGAISDQSISLRKLRIAKLENVEHMFVDLDTVIEQVIVSPRAGEWVADLLQEYLQEDFGISNCVTHSSLG